ncbi:MAG: Asp-tRNA(Asn)/Glu-tRNA(Gln) amidotransferase subunit GatA [Treponema sp.]|jgi:aspartyl-tRNA(Asn)/glutamyl-tRNA(Gln) amidotransferase subunit A|nr:Asp-tRNA(Asn)/Glu-tRNA(Gln) amidotransferase subunit GatA [Treponema sp.]
MNGELQALKIAEAIKSGKLSAPDVVTKYINLIKKNDKRINAFTAVPKEKALLRAKEVQARLEAGGNLSPLAGVPVAIKDNISTEGIETACASKMLGGYTPVFNASVIEKLESAGMIVIGKTNMDEFAMGGSSETGVGGAVCNPWDLSRVAGGSSGGSAAAVAAGEAPIALGSDTGGSIRQPCSFCGVTGIKPTYGAVSRYGLIAYASSLDQIGVIGQDIEDCAALLEIISGKDERDSTCIIEKPFAFDLEKERVGLKSVKIGLPKNYFDSGIDGEVKAAVLMAAKEIEAAGADIEEFEMPFMDYMIPAYYIIACAEASSNLSRYDGLKYGYRSESAASSGAASSGAASSGAASSSRTEGSAKTLSDVYRLSRSEGFGLEVKRRIMLGSFVLSSGYYDAYYKKALQTRALIKDAYKKLFEKYDMILSPVAPTTAYKRGENIDDPIKMYMGDIYTVSVNLAGLPAVSLPCGFDKQKLPIGFQLIGDAFTEKKLIDTARVYQKRTTHHLAKPEAAP